MDRERLYEILDIEEPAEFDYFENIAALLECDENIGYEELYGLLQEVDKETLSMLIDNYFEELSDFLPEDDADFYLKIDQIRRSLVGLAKSSDDKNVLGSLAEELDRFRRWYAAESQVICSDLETGSDEIHPLRDALALARMEKLDGDKYYYDFERCIYLSPFVRELCYSFAKIAQRVLRKEERQALEQSREHSKRLAIFALPRRGSVKGIRAFSTAPSHRQ